MPREFAAREGDKAVFDALIEARDRFGDKEILEDLIMAAHEDARKKAEQAMEEKMKSVTAGLPLPPGMKLPF